MLPVRPTNTRNPAIPSPTHLWNSSQKLRVITASQGDTPTSLSKRGGQRQRERTWRSDHPAATAPAVVDMVIGIEGVKNVIHSGIDGQSVRQISAETRIHYCVVGELRGVRPVDITIADMPDGTQCEPVRRRPGHHDIGRLDRHPRGAVAPTRGPSITHNLEQIVELWLQDGPICGDSQTISHIK